ncbi:MAG: tRNA (adenosine(37)-N6)-dimethylallyltransferase MiaA [Myxococcota bacterium]
MPPPKPPVVVVTGPTAAGKTGIGLALAERFDGEIVNADSMQVYRGLDIGTAKPTPAERSRVPHHGFDVVDPDQPYDAVRYARDATRALDAIHERGRAAFVVGGSGLYIRALLEGLSVGVGRHDELRAELEAEDAAARAAGDPERLHRRLAAVDPTRAGALHPNDRLRIVRALEVYAASGVAPSTLGCGTRPAARWRVLHLAIDPGREALAERIDRRCEAMIQAGLLQEVRRLREAGYGPELPCMRAIGYRHMQPVVDGRETLVNVLAAMQRDTRQFARRQRTWLRSVADVEWCAPEPLEPIVARVKRFLAGGDQPPV